MVRYQKFDLDLYSHLTEILQNNSGKIQEDFRKIPSKNAQTASASLWCGEGIRTLPYFLEMYGTCSEWLDFDVKIL